MNELKQECLKAVNEIIDLQEIALKTFHEPLYDFMPENFKTNAIRKNVNLLHRFKKEDIEFETIKNQLNKVYKCIYSHAAWEIANVINKFPKECRTPDLYLEVFKKNKCILIYVPKNLQKHLNPELAYDNCKYSPDGTCSNCMRSFEIPCSYNYMKGYENF